VDPGTVEDDVPVGHLRNSAATEFGVEMGLVPMWP
jgi:hypothetical protein